VRRLAVYSDIHANLPALEAVLAHIHSQGVTERYCLGDLVGYGPYPEEVVALVRTLGDPVVQGNYDRAIGERLSGSSTRYETPEEVLDGGESYAFTISAVGSDDIAYLGSLPRDLEIREDGVRILLCHGSPRRVAELIMPDTPAAQLAALAQGAGVQVVLCAHSHVPFHRAVPTERGIYHWVNVGSVGRPRDGDPRAAWAEVILGTHDEVLSRAPEDLACRPVGESEVWLCAHVHRVTYDVEAVAAAMAASGLPATLVDGLRTGTEERLAMASSSVAQRDADAAEERHVTRIESDVRPEQAVAAWSPVAARAERLNALADRIAAYEALAVVFRESGNAVGEAVRRLRAAMRSCKGAPANDAALTDAFQNADIALRTTAGHSAFETERERLYGQCEPFNPFGHVLSATELTYLSGNMDENMQAIRAIYEEAGYALSDDVTRLCLGHISVELRFMAHCLKRAITGQSADYHCARDFFVSHLADWAVLFAVVTEQEAREPVMHYAGLALDKFLICEGAAFRLGLPEFFDAPPGQA